MGRVSCEYFDINNIIRIDMMASVTRHDQLWKEGHFPYHGCPRPQPKGSRIRSTIGYANQHDSHSLRLAVLTVLDSNYLEVLPSWAIQIQSLKYACHVIAVDDKVCSEVIRAGCGCFPSTKPPKDLASVSGWHPTRVQSVKRRFEGALDLLVQGYDVLMHDADVFFERDGMEAALEYWSHHRDQNYDFMVQDNGERKVNYDGLNWGFVFMRSSHTSIALLRCTLQRWDDAAFGCGEKKCDSYYMRSQPRINHIVELALQSEKRPKVCKVPTLKSFGARHMTGYPTVAAKLICAKAAGFLSDVLPARLAYDVPRSADVLSQRKALQAALYLAERSNLKLEIPEAFVRGENVEFCRLFDVSKMSSFATAASGKCINVTHIPVTELTLSQPKSTALSRKCISYEALLNITIEGHQMPVAVPLCDPHNPVYDAIHCCERRHGTDEEGFP